MQYLSTEPTGADGHLHRLHRALWHASRMWGKHSPAIFGATAGAGVAGTAMAATCGSSLLDIAVLAGGSAGCALFAWAGGRGAPAPAPAPP